MAANRKQSLSHRYGHVLHALLLCLCLVACVLAACGGEAIDDPDSYMKWAGNSQNGLVQPSQTPASTARARYMSPEQQAYQEIGSSSGGDNGEFDAAVARYARTMTFVVAVPSPAKSSDAFGNAPSLEGGGTLNSEMPSVGVDNGMYAVLRAAGREYHPLLMIPEVSASANGQRNVIVVFGDEEMPERLLNAPSFELEFTDTRTARTDHFQFTRESIEKRRRLSL